MQNANLFSDGFTDLIGSTTVKILCRSRRQLARLGKLDNDVGSLSKTATGNFGLNTPYLGPAGLPWLISPTSSSMQHPKYCSTEHGKAGPVNINTTSTTMWSKGKAATFRKGFYATTGWWSRFRLLPHETNLQQTFPSQFSPGGWVSLV